MSKPPQWTVATLAEALGATVVGDGATAVDGVAMADAVTPGAVTYALNARYLTELEATAAAAVIVGHDLNVSSKPLLQVDVPKAAFARAMELFFPRERPLPGIHASAIVAADATVDSSATVGPHAIIGPGARVGARCVLHAGVHIGAGATVGPECELFDHVVLYDGVTLGARVRVHAQTTIGADGFGYVFDGNGHRKIPQVGTVRVGDDVEIGAAVCIDRGTLGDTRIGTGVRIDNLVQIGHNVDIGDHAILVAQTGISGSTTIGPFAVFGGQAGVADHLTIGAGAVIGASTKVARSVPPGKTMFGLPAREAHVAKRQIGALALLPRALKRLRRLERTVETLRAALEREP